MSVYMRIYIGKTRFRIQLRNLKKMCSVTSMELKNCGRLVNFPSEPIDLNMWTIYTIRCFTVDKLVSIYMSCNELYLNCFYNLRLPKFAACL